MRPAFGLQGKCLRSRLDANRETATNVPAAAARTLASTANGLLADLHSLGGAVRFCGSAREALLVRRLAWVARILPGCQWLLISIAFSLGDATVGLDGVRLERELALRTWVDRLLHPLWRDVSTPTQTVLNIAETGWSDGDRQGTAGQHCSNRGVMGACAVSALSTNLARNEPGDTTGVPSIAG